MESAFNVPADYVIEPELRGEPPREVPPELRHGRADRAARRVTSIMVLVGVILVLLRQWNVIEFLAQFILPLDYLDWIGVGLVVLGVVGFVFRRGRGRAARYIALGRPLVARVVGMVRRPVAEIHGEYLYAMFVAIEFNHPDTGGRELREVQTDVKEPPFRVGDYVTAVYLPSDFDRTLQIYSLLGLRTDPGPVLESTSANSMVKVVLQALGVCAFFVVPLWCLYVMARWSIRDVATLVTLWGMGAGLLGIPAACLCHWAYRRGRVRLQERNLEAAARGGAWEVPAPVRAGFIGQGWVLGTILAAGVLLLMGVLFLCIALSINGAFDASPAREAPVSITDVRITTEKLMFRQYELEYQIFGDADVRTMHTTPDHLRQFLPGDDGVAVLRDGLFGWEWVETIKKK